MLYAVIFSAVYAGFNAFSAYTAYKFDLKLKKSKVKNKINNT